MTELIERHRRVMGHDAPLFYDEPIEFVRGDGVWLHTADGERMLDLYNNVPCVGHANPRVARAVAEQQATLNVLGFGGGVTLGAAVVDDDDLAAGFGLTTMRQPVHELGAAAATLLIEGLEGRESVEGGRLMPVDLVVRDTTGPPPR